MKTISESKQIKKLKSDIAKCVICENHFDHKPNPVCDFSATSKIVIIGQAPGRIVHESGIPWDDKSGDNLRQWMDIDKEVFYDASLIGIVPMGFCYPGTGKSGDLPPRKECAPQWHQLIMDQMKDIELILLIGKYAQDYYLKKTAKKNLTETVRNFYEYLPRYFVLPHPSPRNNIWMKKNEWFAEDLLPILKKETKRVLDNAKTLD